MDETKQCPHRYCGCISQNGYLCLHDGPCDPCDNKGRRFTVVYETFQGQQMMFREFLPGPVQQGNKTVCTLRHKVKCTCQPENNEGKGACGKIINADNPEAPAQVREQCLQKLAEIRAGPHTVRTVH